MSEREIRDMPYAYAGADWMCMYCHTYGEDKAHIKHKKDCLLSAEPDLVALLRILTKELKRHEKELNDGDDGWESGYNYGFYDSTDSIIYDIEHTFGVRLTKTGYEWTEGEGE